MFTAQSDRGSYKFPLLATKAEIRRSIILWNICTSNTRRNGKGHSQLGDSATTLIDASGLMVDANSCKFVVVI